MSRVGQEAGKRVGKGKPKQSAKKLVGSDIYSIVKMIMERHYEPVIIFSFSKKECENHALHMAKLDFCDGQWRGCMIRVDA